eukprot:scaffold697_cov320-Prasinococcus_capsulatus_cf.AAC.5
MWPTAPVRHTAHGVATAAVQRADGAGVCACGAHRRCRRCCGARAENGVWATVTRLPEPPIDFDIFAPLGDQAILWAIVGLSVTVPVAAPALSDGEAPPTDTGSAAVQVAASAGALLAAVLAMFWA